MAADGRIAILAAARDDCDVSRRRGAAAATAFDADRRCLLSKGGRTCGRRRTHRPESWRRAETPGTPSLAACGTTIVDEPIDVLAVEPSANEVRGPRWKPGVRPDRSVEPLILVRRFLTWYVPPIAIASAVRLPRGYPAGRAIERRRLRAWPRLRAGAGRPSTGIVNDAVKTRPARWNCTHTRCMPARGNSNWKATVDGRAILRNGMAVRGGAAGRR